MAKKAAKKAEEKIEEVVIADKSYLDFDFGGESKEDVKPGDPVIFLPRREEPEALTETTDEDDFTGDIASVEVKQIISGVGGVRNDDESETNETWEALKSKIKDLEKKISDNEKEFQALPQLPQQKSLDDTPVSDLFDALYKKIKDERVALVLEAVQTKYFKLKYKTYTDDNLVEIHQKIADKFLSQSLEGGVSAAKKMLKA